MNFSLILAIEFFIEENIMEVPRIKDFKYDRNFQLLFI